MLFAEAKPKTHSNYWYKPAILPNLTIINEAYTGATAFWDKMMQIYSYVT